MSAAAERWHRSDFPDMLIYMKACIWDRYGSPEGLRYGDLPTPVPAADELLVRVHASSITAGDSEMRRMRLPLSLGPVMRIYVGLFRPKRIRVLGQEFAGTVVSCGSDVISYSAGDEVFGTTGFSFGAHAEFITVKAHGNEMQGSIAKKPAQLSFSQAAVLPTAGMEAMHFIQSSNLNSSDRLLIIGAGGSIGSAAIQLARSKNISVTVVDSGHKLQALKATGAEQVYDYRETVLRDINDRFHCIIDIAGKARLAELRRLLLPGAICHVANAGLRHVFGARYFSASEGRKLSVKPSSQSREELTELASLAIKGAIRPIIDRSFPLEEAADAHRYADSGQKIGNIAITILGD